MSEETIVGPNRCPACGGYEGEHDKTCHLGPPVREIQYRRDLWWLFKDVPGSVAEIGVAEGRFSREILEWPILIPRVYLVDRWKSVRHQKGDGSMPQKWHDDNFKQVCDLLEIYPRAMPLRGDSEKMASIVPDHSLALVYIDADHSYEGVMGDIQAWFPKVRYEGFMAFHDYENPRYGVKRAVQDFCKGRFDIHLIPENNPDDAGAWFQVC